MFLSFCIVAVYSFNERAQRIYSISGLMCNNTKISAGRISRTYENQVVPSAKTGQNTGNMRGGAGLRMAPSSVPSQSPNAARRAQQRWPQRCRRSAEQATVLPARIPGCLRRPRPQLPWAPTSSTPSPPPPPHSPVPPHHSLWVNAPRPSFPAALRARQRSFPVVRLSVARI